MTRRQATEPGDKRPPDGGPDGRAGVDNAGGNPEWGCEAGGPIGSQAALARRLREIREELRGEAGARALSDALGVPLWTWQNYERGVAIPALVLLRFIDVTDASPRWLLKGDGPKFTR